MKLYLMIGKQGEKWSQLEEVGKPYEDYRGILHSMLKSNGMHGDAYYDEVMILSTSGKEKRKIFDKSLQKPATKKSKKRDDHVDFG